MSAVVGVLRNPLAPNAPAALAAACEALGVAHTVLELPLLSCRIDTGSGVRHGHEEVRVTHLTPPLLYWQPGAAMVLRVLEARAGTLNAIGAVEIADDKAATCLALAAAGVPQVPTWVLPSVPASAPIALPAVVKRASGAQGRWVRLARTETEWRSAVEDLQSEGVGTLLAQPLVGKVLGETVRVIVLGGRVLASTLRRASGEEWRSNVARGAAQEPTALDEDERSVAEAAAAAVGLSFAGVDIARCAEGPRVIEVNSCPDFTSMTPHVEVDIAGAVIRATLQSSAVRV